MTTSIDIHLECFGDLLFCIVKRDSYGRALIPITRHIGSWNDLVNFLGGAAINGIDLDGLRAAALQLGIDDVVDRKSEIADLAPVCMLSDDVLTFLLAGTTTARR